MCPREMHVRQAPPKSVPMRSTPVLPLLNLILPLWVMEVESHGAPVLCAWPLSPSRASLRPTHVVE